VKFKNESLGQTAERLNGGFNWLVLFTKKSSLFTKDQAFSFMRLVQGNLTTLARKLFSVSDILMH
jgi:hypothetical protein